MIINPQLFLSFSDNKFFFIRTYSPTIQPYTSTTQSTPTTPTTPTTASSSFIFYSHHYEYAG